MLHNYKKVLKKCFLDNACIVDNSMEISTCVPNNKYDIHREVLTFPV